MREYADSVIEDINIFKKGILSLSQRGEKSAKIVPKGLDPVRQWYSVSIFDLFASQIHPKLNLSSSFCRKA